MLAEQIELNKNIETFENGEIMVALKPRRLDIYKLLVECKGDRSWEEFNEKCREDVDCKGVRLERILVRKNARMSIPIIKAVIAHSVPESTVSYTQLLGANGYLFTREVKEILASLQPPMTDRKDLRYKKNRPEAQQNAHADTEPIIEPPFHEDNYEEFLDSYVTFAEEVSQRESESMMPILMEKQADVLLDKTAKKMLHAYSFLKKKKEYKQKLEAAETQVCFGTQQPADSEDVSESFYTVLKYMIFAKDQKNLKGGKNVY